MIAKTKILIICMFFLVACQPNLDTIYVTREAVPHSTLIMPALEVETVVSPTATPAPTNTVTVTPTFSPPEPSVTPPPTQIPTPEFVWPEASLLFVRDNNLQQWMPETGEIKTLAENMTNNAVVYTGAGAVFVREVIPDEEYALVVVHVLTGSEIELFKTSFWPIVSRFDKAISISPNGRWLAYVTGESRDSAVLTVREMTTEGQHFAVNEPILTVIPGKGWYWPYDQIMWPTENEISWSDESGIWVADLNSKPIESAIAIAPSTNTFLFASPNPAYSDEEPVPVFTQFIPYLWSPDGRYLLAEEHFYEYGELRVIERGTNRLAEVPDSVIGAISDDVLWLDETTLLHYQVSRAIHIWQIDPNNDPIITLQETISAVPMGYVGELWSFGNHLLASNYSSLFNINLATGELVEVAQDIGWPLYWSPDGQYVLWNNTTFIDEERQAHVFLDDLRNEPIELDNVLGLNSCCWYWYKE